MPVFNDRSNQIRNLFLFLFCVLVIVSLMIYREYALERKSRLLQEELRSLYHETQPTSSETQPVPATEAKPTPVPTPTQAPEPQLLPQFQELLDANADTVAWISIPGTNIDYPVVQTNDNDYYLERDFHRQPSRAGTLFMDFRMVMDGSDRHQIIYGHHMRDGSMFTELMKYKAKDFFDEHRLIILDQLYERERWEIFSAYVTDVEFYFIETEFADDKAWFDFISLLEQKSAFETDVELSAQDQVLTLVTCTYEFDNARFVVHARRVD